MRDSGTVEKAQRDLGEELAAFRGTSRYSQAALARLVITGRGGPEETSWNIHAVSPVGRCAGGTRTPSR